MKYSFFEIKNFKGIDSIKINLNNDRIVTLVGLNESGKTTVMEAVFAYYQLTKGKKLTDADKNSFRPKGIDFTGKIVLEATVEYEPDDFKKLMKK